MSDSFPGARTVSVFTPARRLRLHSSEIISCGTPVIRKPVTPCIRTEYGEYRRRILKV